MRTMILSTYRKIVLSALGTLIAALFYSIFAIEKNIFPLHELFFITTYLLVVFVLMCFFITYKKYMSILQTFFISLFAGYLSVLLPYITLHFTCPEVFDVFSIGWWGGAMSLFFGAILISFWTWSPMSFLLIALLLQYQLR